MNCHDSLLDAILGVCREELEHILGRIRGIVLLTMLACVAGLLVMVALGFIFYALFIALAASLGTIAAAFILAGICLLTGLAFLGIGLWVFR